MVGVVRVQDDYQDGGPTTALLAPPTCCSCCCCCCSLAVPEFVAGHRMAGSVAQAYLTAGRYDGALPSLQAWAAGVLLVNLVAFVPALYIGAILTLASAGVWLVIVAIALLVGLPLHATIIGRKHLEPGLGLLWGLLALALLSGHFVGGFWFLMLVLQGTPMDVVIALPGLIPLGFSAWVIRVGWRARKRARLLPPVTRPDADLATPGDGP